MMPEGNSGYAILKLGERDELLAIRQKIVAVLPEGGITLSEPETYHITLAYTDEADAIDRTAFDSFEALSVRVSGLILFNNPEERALVLVVDHTPEMDALQRGVYDDLASNTETMSEYSDPDRWQPHITIGYLPDGVDMPQIEFEPFTLAVEQIDYSTGDYEVVRTVMANQTEATTKATTAIKALNDEGRVGGYLVVWGSAQQRDLQNEYFTPDTELGLDWYDKRPALYHHGMDGTLKAATIGAIDTLTEDDTGVWAEAQLDLRSKYVQAVQKLIKKGVLAWSSGSLSHLVERDPDGRIKRWPIVEGSITPTPAEPRHTDINTLKSAYKELGLDIAPLNIPAEDAGEPVTPAPVDDPTGDAIEPEAKEQAAAQEVGGDLSQTSNEEQDMNTEQLVMGAIEQLASGMSLSDEQKAQIAQAILGIVQSEENMDETRAAQVAEQVVPMVAKAINDHKAKLDAARKAADSVTQTAVKNLFGSVQPANATGNGAQVDPPGETNPNIVVYSKYQDLKPEDMVYMRMLAGQSGVRQNTRFPWAQKFWSDMEAVQKFDREIADKIQRSGGKHGMTEAAAKYLDMAVKANELNHSTQANFGDEWVPDLWSNQLWRRARLDNTILPLFRTIEMPSNPFELPIEGADPTVYFVPETTQESELTLSGSGSVIPDSKIGSGKVTMTAKKLALRVGFSAELTEDSIISVIPLYREQAERAIMDSIDHVLLNGDTTNTSTGNINSDDADPADTEKYLAFDGIRHSALVENTANAIDAGNVAASLALLRQARFAMAAQYAMRPGDIAYLVGGEVYASLLDMPQFLTMDVIGQQATILNGQIGQVDGSPVLVSAEYGLTEADGFKSDTANNNTFGQASVVYRPNFYVGYRRRVALDVSYLPYYDAYQLTATVRLAFNKFDTDSTATIYELAV